MNDAWSKLVTTEYLHSETAVPRESAAPLWATPLARQQLLVLEGADAGSFLQGQTTCDLKTLSSTQSLPGAHCSPRGKVIAPFRLLQLKPESIGVRLDAPLAPLLQTSLGKYLVFAKARFQEPEDNSLLLGIGLGGPEAADFLRRRLGAAPSAENEQQTTEGLTLVRVQTEPARFELWLPAAEASTWWADLEAAGVTLPTNFWQARDILAGLVQLPAGASDRYLPQMLNLQAINAISFSKGCYTGQEVVARLQHRGRLKKLLCPATCAAPSIKPETPIATTTGEVAGELLASIPLDDGQSLVQLVLNKADADAGRLHLENGVGPGLKLLPLPQALDPELFERS